MQPIGTALHELRRQRRSRDLAGSERTVRKFRMVASAANQLESFTRRVAHRPAAFPLSGVSLEGSSDTGLFVADIGRFAGACKRALERCPHVQGSLRH
jgi:hypothetical protein